MKQLTVFNTPTISLGETEPVGKTKRYGPKIGFREMLQRMLEENSKAMETSPFIANDKPPHSLLEHT
jgi:hypothetical protein